MSVWIEIWKYVLILGVGAFALSVVVIVPLGARDIWTLVKRLNSEGRESENRTVSDGQTED